MTKSFLALLLVALQFHTYAQIPSGYYSSTTGLSGEALKSALNDIIDGHTEYPYSSSDTDVWDILKVADRDPNNASNVLCLYSGFSRSAAAEYDNGAGWNREHVWSQSRGGFGTDRGAGTDLHHLRAADVSTNSARSNRNFVAQCESEYVDGDGATGSYTCASVYGWEPRDEVKGDIARMLFYMATRYEGENGELDLELTETLQNKDDTDPVHATLSVLLDWHDFDPVSTEEVQRNDIIYSFQGNRNPYIDHPEWVGEIFGNGPSIALTSTSFDFGDVLAGQQSTNTSYQVTGRNLESDISITVSAPFELSLNNTSWSQGISLPKSNAETKTNNTVYVRFSPTVSNAQPFLQEISHTSTNASSAKFIVLGAEGDGSSVRAINKKQSFEGGAEDSWSFTQSPADGTLSNADDRWEVMTTLGDITTLPSHGVRFFGGQDIKNDDNPHSWATLDFESVSIEGNTNVVISFDYQAIGFDSNDNIAYSLDGGTHYITLFSGQVGGASSSSSEIIIVPEGMTSVAFQIKVTQDGASDFCGFDNFSIVGELPAVRWNGSINSDWFEADNWDSGQVPGAADNVIVESTTLFPIVTGDAQANNLEISTGSHLKVKSGSSLALFGEVSGSGQVTIERNSTGNAGYSIMGSPVTSTLVSDFEPDYAFRYDGEYDAHYGAMNPGEGYFIGFDAVAPLVSFVGTPNSGEISYQPAENGFQLIANPYTAAISIESFQNQNAGTIDGTVYFWNDGGVNQGSKRAGSYVTVNALGSVGTVFLGATGQVAMTSGSSFIASMQGVFVNVVDTSSPILFTPTMQTNEAGANSDDNYYRHIQKATVEDAWVIELQLSDKRTASSTMIGLVEGASEGLDFGLDALKMKDAPPTIYSLQQGQAFAIQSLPPSDHDPLVIPLGIEVPTTGVYTLKPILTGVGNYQTSLIDHVLGTTYNLTDSYEMTISLEEGRDEARFELRLSPIALENQLQSEQLLVFPNPTTGSFQLVGPFQGSLKVRLYDQSGREVFTIQGSKHFVEAQISEVLAQGDAGNYLLLIETENQSYQLRMVKR